MDDVTINSNCPQCLKLLELLRQQQGQIAEQQKHIEQLTKRLEKVERAGKRQAAPFRKGSKAGPAKKPGRRSGNEHGEHHRREVPPRIDESYEVPLPECCPCCQSENLCATGQTTQYQTEIPRTVIYRKFEIEVGKCEDCGQRVQGRHELQTSDATRACNSQLGPNLQSAMTLLNKELGLSHGKVRRAIEMLFRLKIARSTSCRSMLRMASRLGKAYQGIRRSVRGSPQVVPDETGWRCGGQSAWLHVFVGWSATCYRIDGSRSSQIAFDILGEDFAGDLVHDGWSPYDKLTQATHQQCMAHILRRLDSLIERAGATSLSEFPQRLKELLLSGLDARDKFLQGGLSLHGCRVRAGQLQGKLVHEFLNYTSSDLGQQRMVGFLEKHFDSLFNYLRHPGTIDATNWRAEQAIRPAVVNRKVWGGNRTPRGAEAQSTIMSLFRTCQQRGKDAFAALVKQATSPENLSLTLLTR